MKRFSEQFNTKAKSIRLSVAEKRDLHERLVAYMEYHPLTSAKTEIVTDLGKNLPAAYTLKHLNIKRFLQWSASFVFIFVFGLSYLAERAIPGDTLYAIKVGFNEELRSTLARGSYEKVVWETERLNRRIAEARLLASEGRLTEEVEAQVASAVKVHSDNARKEIENLKLNDIDEASLASIELNTALDVQTTSLRNRGNTEPTAQPTTLIETVLAASQAAGLVVEESNLPAYNRLMAKVESETTRAHELLKGVAKSATLEERTDIKRRLEDIERKIGSAMGLFENDEVAARKGLVEVLQQTQRLIVFMTNIDVRANLTVNDIVPVTLTEEERLLVVKKQVMDTKALTTLVTEALNASSSVVIEVDILEKVEPALKQVLVLNEEVEQLSSVTPLQIETLESVSQTAHDLILDTAILLNLSPTTTQSVDKKANDSSVIKIPESEVGAVSSSTERVKVPGGQGSTSTESISIDTEIKLEV